jgi:hypothetical protein
MLLIFVTAILGFISTLISKRLTRVTFTPCLWYWVGWLSMLIAYELSRLAGILPEIRPLAQDLIIQAHIGAFFGFVIASIMIPVLRGIPKVGQLRPYDIQLPKRFVRIILWTYGVVGLAHLAYRIASVDRITSSILYDIRVSYIIDPYGFTQISSYIFTSVWVVAGLFGWEDANHGIQMKRLSILFFVSGLHGVAMGGRGWIVAVPLTYAFSYLLARDNQRLLASVNNVLKLTRKLSWVIVMGFVSFVLLAILRSPDPATKWVAERELPWYQRKESIMMPLWYLALPIDGIDVKAEYAAAYGPVYGQLLFPWFAKQLGRLGLLENMEVYATVLGDEFLRTQRDIRGWAQATVLPVIVGDFGMGSVPYVMATLMGMSQIFAICWRRRGIWKHSVAVMLTVAAFHTIQDAWFGIDGNVWGLGWAALFQLLINKNCRKESLCQDSLYRIQRLSMLSDRPRFEG